MLITSFEAVDASKEPILFRGQDSFFWKRHIFHNAAPFDPEKNGENQFGFIFIFDSSQFLFIESEGVDEIFDEIKHRDPDRDAIFSIDGKPFFAVSRGAFNKLKLNLNESREFHLKLKNNGNARIINLKSLYSLLDMKRDMELVEKAVVSFQIRDLMARGVTVEDFGNFYMEGIIPIGEGTRLSSGVVLKGNCSIGKNVQIYPHAYIENSTIADNCIVLPGSIIMDSVLEEGVQIGPYTHLRMGSVVKTGAKMGNFVEMKKSILGEGSKAMHLSYIGDAEIGKKANIGAGTITCNYDGVNKNKTFIEDGVFIGSGTELVAPVTVRKNSYVAAGSTITEEVPEGSLAVARQRQRNLNGWVDRKRKKDKETPSH